MNSTNRLNIFLFIVVSLFLTASAQCRANEILCRDLFGANEQIVWTQSEIGRFDSSRDIFAGNDQPWRPELQLTNRPAGGSQGGRWYIDKQNRSWFGKDYEGDLTRMRAELLTNRLYQALGVRVPLMMIVEYAGKPLLVSLEVQEYKSVHSLSEIAETDLTNKFVYDAFFANWDVLGADFDNLLVKGTQIVRVDQGGTLFYRAMNGLKEFSENVTELDSMRNSNYSAGRAFHQISDAQLAGQIREFIGTYSGQSHFLVKRIVSNSGFAPEVRNRLMDTLDRRFFWIANTYLPQLLERAAATQANLIKRATEELRGEYGQAIWESELQQVQYRLRKANIDPNLMSIGEWLAIYAYVCGRFDPMNNALRGRTNTEADLFHWLSDNSKLKYQSLSQAHIIFLAKQGLAKLPEVKAWVTRIAELPPKKLEEYEVGKVVTEKAFTSSTLGGFAPYRGNITFQIYSKHGRSISFFNEDEKEVLFTPHTQFKILKKVKETNDRWSITMAEI